MTHILGTLTGFLVAVVILLFLCIVAGSFLDWVTEKYDLEGFFWGHE